MATSIALNITPINPPKKELEAMPVADKDYLIQDLVGDKNQFQTFCQLRNSFSNNCDMYGILLGPYNTSDYPLILLVEPTYYIFVPM